MEFRCDRCATRYSTTQAVHERQAYTYQCRLCGYTIFVRAAKPPAETPPPRPAGPAEPAGVGPAGVFAGSVPRREASLSTLPADLFGGKSVIGPGDLPPPSDGYIDLTLDDDPPPRRPALADAGPRPAITLPALTPVPAPPRRGSTPAAPLPLPRPRASLRPADGPNRAARAELTPTAPIPLARRPRGLEALLGRRGLGPDLPPLKVTRRQRLLVAAAVFPVVTAAAMALGVAFAARTPEPPRPQATVHAATAAAPPPRLAPPPVTPPPPPAPRAVPAAPAQAPPAAVPDSPRAAVTRPVRREPAPREPRAAREPARAAPRSAGSTRDPRVASAPAPRRVDPAGAALAAAGPGPGTRAPPSAPHPSAAPPPRREEEPVVPRPGFRPPAPLVPHCVEEAIRLPARWEDRLPGSVILRFAVGRDGAADLVQLQPGPDRRPGERVEPDLAQALRAAVRGCRFAPGLDDRGQAVRMWVVMKVQFAG